MIKKTLYCVECGKPITNTNMRGMCQSCWKYFHEGGQIYPLPKYGEVGLDPDGKPICHICGRSYRKLGAHVMNSHNMSAREYKIKFGLDKIKGLTCKDYKEMMRDMVLERADTVIAHNLLSCGTAHRFQPGSKGRTADQMSEQTRRRVAKMGTQTGPRNIKLTPNSKKHDENINNDRPRSSGKETV